MPVINSSYETLGSVLFGQPTQDAINYFEGVRDKVAQRTDIFAGDFIANTKSVFENIYSSRAMELARAAINKAGALFSPDIVKELITLTDFQTAKPQMRRIMMANPVIRQRWMDNRCEGYGESYVDFEPGAIGENHYDYRRVMDGIVHEVDGESRVKVYFEELREGDVAYSASERIDAVSSWRNCENMMLLAAKDPTSEWNSDL